MSYGYNPNVANLEEAVTDSWINQNIPGGVNSAVGQALDNVLGADARSSFGPYNPGIANLEEAITDSWINQNIRGGVSSQAGQALDNILGAQQYQTMHRRY